MKKLYASLLIIILLTACFLLALSGGAKSATSVSVQLVASSTPTPIAGVLKNTGQSIECYIVTATPSPTATITLTPYPTSNHYLFSTATKLAQETPIPITPLPSITPTLPTTAMTVTASPYLNLRQCAGTSCPVLRTLANGMTVQATLHREQVGATWWRLVSVDGQAGWVSEVYIQ